MSVAIFLFSVVESVPGSSNDLSRLAGIISVARFNSLNIDKTPQVVTRDKAFYDGKFYSSKPPFMNWVSGVFIKYLFLGVKPALLTNDIPIYKTATFINVTIPLIFLMLLFYWLLSKRFSSLTSCLISVLAVFSTLLFSYAGYLNNHIPVAFLTLVLYILIFEEIPIKVFKRKYFSISLAGLVSSLILAYDPPFMFLVALVLLPCLYFKYKKDFFKNILILIIFALPISVLHFYLTYQSFGIFTIPQLDKETFFSYPGSHFSGIADPTDINVYSSPFLVLLFNNLVGSHGIFLYMPILLFFIFYKSKKNLGWIFILSLLVISVAAYSIFSPNFGGWSYGNRRLIPLVPLLYYYAVLAFSEVKKKGIKVLFIFLLVASIFFSYLGFKNTWFNKKLHINRDFSYFPLLYNLNKDYFKVFPYDP